MRNHHSLKIISATIHPPVDSDLNSLLRSRKHAREAGRWRGAITLTEEIQEEEGSNGKISNVGGIRFDVPLHKAYEHVNLQLPGVERGGSCDSAVDAVQAQDAVKKSEITKHSVSACTFSYMQF